MDDLTSRLASADPMRGPLRDPRLDDALVALHARVRDDLAAAPDHGTTAPARRTGLRRTGARVGALAAVLCAGAVGTAAAREWIPTHTGTSVAAPEAVTIGSGEHLRMDGDDWRAVVAATVADVPFPADPARRAATIAGPDFRPQGPVDGAPVLASTGAVRAGFAKLSVCAFADAWGAGAPGSPERRAATDGLARLLASPAVRDVDPHPAAGSVGDSGTGDTTFGRLPAIVDAARSGSPDRMRAAVRASEYCMIAGADPARDTTHLATARR